MSTYCPHQCPRNVHTDIEKEKEKEKETIITTSNSGRPDFNTVEAYATSNLEYLSPGKCTAQFSSSLSALSLLPSPELPCSSSRTSWSYLGATLGLPAAPLRLIELNFLEFP